MTDIIRLILTEYSIMFDPKSDKLIELRKLLDNADEILSYNVKKLGKDNENTLLSVSYMTDGVLREFRVEA